MTSLTQKVNLLKNEGVDAVIPLSFTRQLAQLSARAFVGLLRKYLRMRGLVIGPDFTLGRNREGNTDTLPLLGRDMGFSVTVIPPVKVNGEAVSSTAIRNALFDGDMERVTNLIGRPYSLEGRVTTGAGRGLELGFPTANLDIDRRQALPAEGVYATWAYIDNKAYQSMTNIGRRPTFDGDGRTVETYILNYHGNLYKRKLKIDIVERLRAEKQFDTVEKLKNQIAADIEQGRALFNSRCRNWEGITPLGSRGSD